MKFRRINRKLFNFLIMVGFFVSLPGCEPYVSDQSLSKGDGAIRSKAVHGAAFTFGAQSGLAWQAKNITKICNEHDEELAAIYNFNRLLMSHNLLPPVLSDAKDTLRLTGNTIRLSDRVIEIIAPAKFVSTPPLWRDYLVMQYQMPDQPDVTLLPRNYTERQLWDEAVVDGFQQGVQQANQIFKQNLGRLNRDINGISLYHALYAQHMVTAPKTATAKLGVTGNQKRMRVNDQLLRITAHSNLRVQEVSRWQPAVIQPTPVKSNEHHYVARK